MPSEPICLHSSDEGLWYCDFCDVTVPETGVILEECPPPSRFRSTCPNCSRRVRPLSDSAWSASGRGSNHARVRNSRPNIQQTVKLPVPCLQLAFLLSRSQFTDLVRHFEKFLTQGTKATVLTILLPASDEGDLNVRAIVCKEGT